MDLIKLDEARVLLVDSQLQTRRLLKDALHMIGFRKIEDLAKVAELKPVVEHIEPDLILIDIDEDREFVCAAIQDIRNRRLGHDPFVAIIAMTWRPDQDAISAVLSAGTDDIVMKPVSGKILRDRVKNLIENRKDFVVTSSYVGPDRREEGRAGSDNDLPTIKVPNALRHATTKDESAAVDPGIVTETMRSLCAQKIFRLSSDITEIATSLRRQCDEAPDRPLSEMGVGSVSAMLGEIQDLIGEHEFESIRQIAQSTSGILEGIVAAGTEATPKQLELLHLHGQAIAVTLKQSDDSAGALVSALTEAAQVVNG